jgi:hypothetical protein
MNAGARTVNTRRETDFSLPGKNARSLAARINLLMFLFNRNIFLRTDRIRLASRLNSS